MIIYVYVYFVYDYIVYTRLYDRVRYTISVSLSRALAHRAFVISKLIILPRTPRRRQLAERSCFVSEKCKSARTRLLPTPVYTLRVRYLTVNIHPHRPFCIANYGTKRRLILRHDDSSRLDILVSRARQRQSAAEQ